MNRKSTLLALAATAALGLAMLLRRQPARTVVTAAATVAAECTAARWRRNAGGHGGGGHISHVGHPGSSPLLSRELSPPDLVRGSHGRLHR